MKTEEIIFTEEMFKLLFNKVDAICKTAHRVSIDYIRVTDDAIYGIKEDTYSNDWDSYEINIEELNNSDLESLYSNYLEKERIRKEQEAEARRLIAEQNRIRKEKEEYRKYLELKAKFEKL